MQEQRVDMYVRTIVAADDMHEDNKLKEMRKEINKDNNNLQALEKVRGWVKKEKSYRGYLRRLYAQRENIMVKDNLLMCGSRAVISDIMNTKLLYRIHRGHQRAGNCVWLERVHGGHK